MNKKFSSGSSRKQLQSRSSLLLTEIMIAILFFAVISAICLMVFAKSHNFGQDTRLSDFSVTETTSIAEEIRADANSGNPAGEITEMLAAAHPEAENTSDGLVLYFDQDLNPCKEADAACSLTITETENDTEGLYSCTLTVSKPDTETGTYQSFYTVPVSVYQQKGGPS